VRTRIILITSLALLAVAAAALAIGGSDERDDPGPGTRAVAGFYPLAYAAEQLGGPGVAVENLTPPGAEPHDIEISPDDVEAVRSADLVLLMGEGFQPQLEQAADQSEGEVLELLDTPGLALLADEDPHVWLDPIRYGEIVRRIAVALGDPDAARPLTDRLRGLDREFEAGLSDCAREDLVTSHEAFGYLAQRYGLNQIAIAGVSPEAEPSPGELAEVAAAIERSGATTVYSETLLSPRLAETVARETGAETRVLNPLEGLTEEEQDSGEDYFSIMRQNLAELRAGLECR